MTLKRFETNEKKQKMRLVQIFSCRLIRRTLKYSLCSKCLTARSCMGAAIAQWLSVRLLIVRLACSTHSHWVNGLSAAWARVFASTAPPRSNLRPSACRQLLPSKIELNSLIWKCKWAPNKFNTKWGLKREFTAALLFNFKTLFTLDMWIAALLLQICCYIKIDCTSLFILWTPVDLKPSAHTAFQQWFELKVVWIFMARLQKGWINPTRMAVCRNLPHRNKIQIIFYLCHRDMCILSHSNWSKGKANISLAGIRVSIPACVGRLLRGDLNMRIKPGRRGSLSWQNNLLFRGNQSNILFAVNIILICASNSHQFTSLIAALDGNHATPCNSLMCLCFLRSLLKTSFSKKDNPSEKYLLLWISYKLFTLHSTKYASSVLLFSQRHFLKF